ncbi:integrase, catalytic region, zinc finger, CCHC-type containing protein, partial [Tanacetum coccineum]
MNIDQDRQMLMVDDNVGNQFRENAVQNVGHLVRQNAVQNQGTQNVGNQNGISVVSEIANQYRNGNVAAARAEGNANENNGAYEETERANANCTLENNLQQASTSGTQSDKAPVYDSDGSAELLEPIPESHQVPQNDSNVISEVSSVEQSGGIVEQHPATPEETRALYDSLYNNLATEVEKVNSVNRKLRETNADLTTEFARYKNQKNCFEISQEKYDKLKRCYQKSVYQEQSFNGKKSTVSSLLEEKKRLKSDFKIREDELLDKQIQLENKIKELDNILVKMGQSIQTMHMLSPKPDSFYHTEQKMALGYQNPFYLKQAQQKQQSLYNGKVLLEKHDPPAVFLNSVNTQFCKQSILGKPLSSSGSKLYAVTPFLKSKGLPKECLGLILLSLLGKKSMYLTKLEQALGQIRSLFHNLMSSLRKMLILTQMVYLYTEQTTLLRPEGHSLGAIQRMISLLFSNDKSEVVCAMCKQCLITANHDVCVLNYVNDMNSCGKKQKANVSNTKNQKKQKPKVMKPKKVGSNERLASPKPSKPRSCLRWSPTGRLFDLKGKIIASSESESQSDCSNGDNACTSNPPEPTIKRFPNSTSFLGRLSKFFLGTVRFGNDHVAAILGFSDLQWGNILITRVYFVEGLGHNLFSVGQFCDSDLEVAFRRNTCFVRNLEGVDLLKGNRTTNLYTINLHEMASASPICLMARATSTKSWLWHQRLSHLNFDTINDLAKNDLVIGLPKFKYHKEHLCPSYWKLGAKGDIGFFIGYSADSCAYRVYNRRTKKIMETMNVTFDELSAVAFEQSSSKPGLQGMTSRQISSGLDLTYASSTITTQQPTEGELDLLFEAMHDDYIGG